MATRRRRKRGGVKRHRRIRDTCAICGRRHSTNKHRFHGIGSFARTHGTVRRVTQRAVRRSPTRSGRQTRLR